MPRTTKPPSEWIRTYAEWIAKGLEQPGKSRAGLAKALGVKPQQISNFTGGKRPVKAFQIPTIANYLGVPPPKADVNYAQLPTQDVAPSSPEPLRSTYLSVNMVPVRGEIAAGLWREQDVVTQTDYPPVPALQLDFPHSEQLAYRVHGNSMNKRRILDGDFVICVPYFERRAQLTDGDIAVVERRDGHLIERTLKIVRVTAEGYRLEPDSTELTHKPIMLSRDWNAEDGIQVEAVGFVVGVYVPMQR